jgi:putative restriction endonuclease
MPDARAHRSWLEFRYHFSRTYLRAVEASVGDWIIYYEPRRTTGDLSSRGGRLAYFATARVAAVRPDPTMPDRFYAFVEDFLQFPRSVPFKDGDVYYESALRRTDGGTSKGAFGRAVRPISDSEYGLILSAASSELFAAAISSSALPRFPAVPYKDLRTNRQFSSVPWSSA